MTTENSSSFDPYAEISHTVTENSRTTFEIAEAATAQIEQVTIRSEDRDASGRLLAFPDGPVSNLPERYWRLVRTPAFKEWFGEWQTPKVASFKTAQGSVYTYSPEGKTTRFKTATNEQHAEQDVTVFVNMTPDDEQDFLHSYRKEGNNRKGKIQLLERLSDDTPKIIQKMTDVSDLDRLYLSIVTDGRVTKLQRAFTRPIIGYNVFDMRHFEEDGKTIAERHLGNKVVIIEYADTNMSKILEKNGEPLIIANDDGSVSFVKMTNPINTTVEAIAAWYKSNNLEGDPDRFDALMDHVHTEGYDGLTVKGMPVRDDRGRPSCDESQILVVH